jgi:hypothetical protein
MLYYHGSSVGGLKVLTPQATFYEKKPYVYLSTSEIVATFYILKRNYMWYVYSFTPEGIVQIIESFQGHLTEFYGNLQGYLYTCEGDFAVSNPTGIQVGRVCENPVAVKDCVYIENGLDKLHEYEAAGRLIIHRWENQTAEQHAANKKMVLGAIKKLDLRAEKHPLSAFVKEKSPDYWAEAAKSND